MEIIKRAVLHNTLLLGGANLQLSLDTTKRTGLQMIHDEEAQMLYVHNNGEFAKLPYPNVAHMIPAETKDLAKLFRDTFTNTMSPAVAAAIASAPRGRVKAQASSPTDHVFANGAGKTND